MYVYIELSRTFVSCLGDARGYPENMAAGLTGLTGPYDAVHDMCGSSKAIIFLRPLSWGGGGRVLYICKYVISPSKVHGIQVASH